MPMAAATNLNAKRRVLDLAGARVPRTDLSRADLRQANLSFADLSFASLKGADLKGAILKGTILIGADLTEAKNLTVEQLNDAVIDGATLLPDYLARLRKS
jgi:uncharacterized protein YjbI with pentapeptide repeats